MGLRRGHASPQSDLCLAHCQRERETDGHTTSELSASSAGQTNESLLGQDEDEEKAKPTGLSAMEQCGPWTAQSKKNLELVLLKAETGILAPG